MSLRASLLAVAAATLIVSGCDRDRVETYRVAHEKDPELVSQTGDQGGGSMADSAVPTAQGQGLSWTAPADWKQKPAKEMRKASYAVTSAGAECDLSVTAFPGDVGGELANINRWRQQLGLAALAQGDLGGAATRIDVGGLKVSVVELGTGGESAGGAILGAIVPLEGETWFFKLTGPAASVRAARGSFMEFVGTLRSGTAPAPMADAAVPTVSDADLAWQVPAGWTPGEAGQMRKAAFGVATASGPCEVTVTAFPGDVGGELANVNRWRSQVGSPALGEAQLEAALTRFESNGLRFAVAEAGGDSGKALVAAMVPHGQGMWFFKLTGEAGAVRLAKPGFVAFLHSVHAP